MAGAPLGNQNAAKSRVFSDAVRRAIAQDDGQRIRTAAERLLDLAANGEAWAVKELFDRLEGKALQTSEVTLDAGPRLIETLSRLNESAGRSDPALEEGRTSTPSV